MAGNAMENHLAFMDAFVQRLGAGKDVMHARNSMGMMDGGKTGVCGIFLRPVVEESVLHLQIVDCKNMEKVIASNIASCNAMWTQYFFVFVAGTHTNPCINVTAQDNLCVWVNGAKHGVK
jgi:hypothetical protein